MGVAVDLTAGTFAGAGQLVVGHPFDTIKVKLQSQAKPAPGQAPQYAGAMDALRQTLANEGVRGLFKGLAAPLATVAIYNAVLFAARGQMEGMLAHADGSPLGVQDQVIAGAGAGAAGSLVACPTEMIKCRLQAQAAAGKGDAAKQAAGTTGAAAGRLAAASQAPKAAVTYKGPLDVMAKVMAKEGGAVGLFKGMVPTLAREVPGNAVMFGVYQWNKLQLARMQGVKDIRELGSLSLVGAGALAGASFWATVYPADVIKSKIQLDANPNKGMVSAFKEVMASHGVAGFYRGFSPALVRALPANATSFIAYELIKTALS